MSSLRVALLTPTFWPVSNRLLAAVRGLGEGLQQAGAEVTIFTEKLEPDWSSRLRFRDWNVVRVERPAARPWSRGRFGKALLKAVSDELTRPPEGGQTWDAVLVCDWPEALFALEGQTGKLTDQLLFWFDRPPPLEARPAAALRAWQSGLRGCNLLLSPHPRAASWLAALGETSPEVIWHPDSLAVVEPAIPSGATKEASRKTLSEIHPLLNFERNQLLALSAAELSGDAGVFDLLTAWRHVRRDEPRAQLLLVGDGPQARAVWSRIHDWHLQGNVVMPGCFDDHQDLIRAADFYIHPLRGDASCPFLSQALRLGTPCVISHASPWAGELVAGKEAWIFQPGSTPSLLEAVREAVADPARRRSVAQAGALAFEQAVARAQPFSSLLNRCTGTEVKERSGAGF